MRLGIFIALTALALAVVAIPQAEGASGRTLDIRFSGSNFITSSTPDGRPTPLGAVSTSLQSGIAKGSGNAIFSSQTVIEEAGAFPEACGPLPGAPLSTTLILTYNDGSILSIATRLGSYYCYEPVEGIFFVDFSGVVTGGTGRFEGATGSWSGSAEAQSARVTAEASIDLD